MSKLTVDQYMTKGPFMIGQEQSVEKAKVLMESHNIRHLPVQHGGKLVGILSIRDIQMAIDSAQNFKIEDIMTQEPYIIEPGTSLETVALRMFEQKLSSAVIAKDQRVQGIFTYIDALRALSELLKQSR